MESVIIPLSDIPVGASCRVCGVDKSLSIKGRLRELGFYENALIDKLLYGPCGSPVALRVCGAVIALRAEDTEKILVSPCDALG